MLEAWNKVITENNQVKNGITRKHLEGTMGLQMKEIGKRLFPQLNEDERELLLKNLSRQEIPHLSKHGGRLYEHVEKVLIELSKKYRLFIVSNCQDGYIEAFYEYHGLDKHFIDYENPGRTGLSKGENIKLIIERNHLKEPVYIGDTEGDHQASKEAEIPFVYARYGFGEVENPDCAIESFDELLRLF